MQPGWNENIYDETTSGVGSFFALLESDPLWFVVLCALIAAGTLLAIIFVLRQLLCIARPNEALIFSGKRYQTEDGTMLGYHVIKGGQRAVRIPLLERVDRMDMRLIPIDIVVENAYSKGNIPLQIHAIANVKVHSEPRQIRNAVERFLGRSSQEIRAVAQQTLEGVLREVLAQLTPEEVNEDRLKFAESLIRSADDDLHKLGLELDTLKIQHVADQTGYLDSLGRPQIAAALRDAENAENEAQQEITAAQARATQSAEVAKAMGETAVLQKRNELRKVQAELEGEAQAIEREAEAAAKTARAEAERELQALRGELEHKRLQAEIVIPAEVQRQAQAQLAIGAAAPTVQNGAAAVEVLQLVGSAWQQMGPQAKDIYIIQHLEEIVGTVVHNLKDVAVNEVHVLDRGDGTALASYAATYPQMVGAVMKAVRESIGVDIPAVVSGANGARTEGRS